LAQYQVVKKIGGFWFGAKMTHILNTWSLQQIYEFKNKGDVDLVEDKY
jgi:hypothetical protein